MFPLRRADPLFVSFPILAGTGSLDPR